MGNTHLCLCTSCSKFCNSCLRTELSLRGKLSFIQSKSGEKFTGRCNFYSPKIDFKALTNSFDFSKKTTQTYIGNIQY